MAKLKPRLFAAAGLAGLAFGAAAVAAPTPGPTSNAGCRLQISPPTANWTIYGFDPFAGQPASRAFDLTFKNTGTGPCKVQPVARLDGETFGLAGPGGARLLYTLTDEGGDQDATPAFGANRNNGQRTITIQPNGQQVLRYRLDVNVDLPRDGLYQQRVVMSGEAGMGDPLAQATVTLGLDVTPSAVMNLRGAFRATKGGGLIDLGDLEPGSVALPLALYVESTRGYRVTVDSANNGYLQLGSSAWKIRYGMVLGGKSMDLQSVSRLEMARDHGAREDTLAINFIIGDVNERRAGAYSDLLTFSIAPM